MTLTEVPKLPHCSKVSLSKTTRSRVTKISNLKQLRRNVRE